MASQIALSKDKSYRMWRVFKGVLGEKTFNWLHMADNFASFFNGMYTLFEYPPPRHHLYEVPYRPASTMLNVCCPWVRIIDPDPTQPTKYLT